MLHTNYDKMSYLNISTFSAHCDDLLPNNICIWQVYQDIFSVVMLLLGGALACYGKLLVLEIVMTVGLLSQKLLRSRFLSAVSVLYIILHIILKHCAIK